MRVFLLLWVLFFLGTANSAAQEPVIRINIPHEPAREIEIEGELSRSVESLSFRNSYAGVLGLGDRVVSIESFGENAEAVSFRKIAPGEFRSTMEATRFRYRVKLDIPNRAADMAHVSWLNGEAGFLMLSDLLPSFGTGDSAHPKTRVEFILPPGWSVGSSIRPNDTYSYLVSDPEKAVFFVGRSLRENTRRIGSMEFVLIESGEWSFSDDEVMKIAVRVIRDYSKLTRFQLTGRSVVMLTSFPGAATGGHWSAETRGSTTTLVFDRQGRRRSSLAQLGVIFTHELFHFWVPNALGFAGDYDWFFEGFTLYQALRAALRLGFIDFNEYLFTISRVYNSYLSLPVRNQLSLLEASERRWTGLSSLVYDKGLLVAFIYDLALRGKTGGKSSLDDIYRALFLIRRDELVDANKAIIDLLSTQESMKELTRSYIQERGSIELESLLEPYGIKVGSKGSEKRLVVGNPLTKEQRELLHSLGYKN